MTILQTVTENHQKFRSVKEMAAGLGLNTNTVHIYLNRLGIRLQGSGRKSLVAHNIFDKSSDSRYWCGYIAADGCIRRHYNGISIVSKDVDHALKFKNFIGSGSYAYYRDDKVTVSFSSVESKKYLVSIGITPAKSLTLELHEQITWDMFRGIFDGDGCVRFRLGNGCEVHITSASYRFLEQLQSFLAENEIVSNIRVKDKKSKNLCYGLYVSQKCAVQLYHLMYNNATTFLERKEQIMRNYVETRKLKSDEFRESPAMDNPEPSLS